MFKLGILAFVAGNLAVGAYPVENRFVPKQRIAGIGADRANIRENTAALDDRILRMYQAMTWGIMKHPRVVDSAKAVTDERLENIFRKAAEGTGVITARRLQAIAFVESGGDENAKSPTGPVGPMQITKAAGKDMGIYAERKIKKKVTVEKKIRSKGRTRVVKVPKVVTVVEVIRDDRRIPEIAIPAARRHLEKLVRIFGREDFGIAAYHGGAHRVMGWLALDLGTKVTEANAARFVAKHNLTLPKLFFGCSPVYKRSLYRGLMDSMRQDYSPTYWFRVVRGEQLLSLYRGVDKGKFRELARENQNKADSERLPPSRFWSWLTREEFVYKDRDDLRSAIKKGDLVMVPNSPRIFGFSLRTKGPGRISERDLANQNLYLHATKDVRGTIMYIAYELRRLAGKREFSFEITSLVRSEEYQGWLKRGRNGNPNAGTSFPTHLSGKVFDVPYAKLTARQKEALEFVLQDLEWAGLLGFAEESRAQLTFHIAPAPSARQFFAGVY